jgi:hypothetical protein
MHACTHARMHACTHARMHACTSHEPGGWTHDAGGTTLEASSGRSELAERAGGRSELAPCVAMTSAQELPRRRYEEEEVGVALSR